MTTPEISTFTKPLTPKELADFYSVSKNTVYFWVSRPAFPRIKVGRHLRFDLARVQHYFAEQTESEDLSCQTPRFSVQAKRSNRSLTTSVNASRVDPKKKGTEHGNY